MDRKEAERLPLDLLRPYAAPVVCETALCSPMLAMMGHIKRPEGREAMGHHPANGINAIGFWTGRAVPLI